jgi:hypothetical protein
LLRIVVGGDEEVVVAGKKYAWLKLGVGMFSVRVDEEVRDRAVEIGGLGVVGRWHGSEMGLTRGPRTRERDGG